MAKTLFQRQSLDEIITIPDDIISVYVVENHIWRDGGSQAARQNRQVETRTIEEFLIDPVRSFLNDIFRQMAAPYAPARRDNPIGQGYWIQAEFGSGKSHLLSFIGALALGDETAWDVVREKERKAGLGRRESLYNFYENGLAQKNRDSKGIFVAVKTLVGQGGGAVGLNDSAKSLTEYVLDAVAEQFYVETGRALPLYPAEILIQRFLNGGDLERYRRDLGKFLKDPAYFDEEEQEELGDFLADLQNPDPGTQRDCGERLWRFYEEYLQTRPKIPMESEDILKHMVQRLLAEGYAGLLLILDEVSLFMKGRAEAQRVEDEKCLVVLSNRLAKVESLPIWTVCTAQQAIESKMGVKNIIARERLDLIPLLNKEAYYYDIALARVREIIKPNAIDQYYEDYKRSFSWPEAEGRDRFAHFFPFYPPSIDVVRAISYNLTTVRSALYFMLQTLKTQRKRHSRELITLWALFDDVVEYEEDPSGTTRGIANLKTKWPDEWKAYEAARHQLDTIVRGPLKVYRSRCEKIIKTLFLYHVANMAPNGLGHEALMNSVMEWRDQDKEQEADLQDNLDHYEILCGQIATELAQVSRVGQEYRFNATSSGPDPRDLFQRARTEAEQNEAQQRQAWEALLALNGWPVTTNLMTVDLAAGTRSLFRDIAPANQTDISIKWHGREISGRVFMRDLLNVARHDNPLPVINSPETGLDFQVFISATPAVPELDRLIARRPDGRILFWSPDTLTLSEKALLIDFAAYRALVGDYRSRDTQEARDVLTFVQNRLREQMGAIYRLVPDSYGRGRMAALDHSQLEFTVQGELAALLTPLVAQLLDAVYLSKELEFSAPAPFNDTNAINVINGIVKTGQIPRGTRPDRNISAAQNYGFDLQIMRRPNDKKLDLSACRYTGDMAAWIEARLSEPGSAMAVSALYKNFMGVNGPNGQNYGLSKSLVQLYLLCLVQEGKVRLTLSGSNRPVEAIDYSNIAAIEFKKQVLDSLDQVQRLKPPEGWPLLAPFAAILLDNAALAETRQDADAQAGVRDLLAFKEETLRPLQTLRAGLETLFTDLGQPNPWAERLAAWEKFLAARITGDNQIMALLHALDEAFGYRVFRDEAVQSSEVDDLATRRQEWRQAEIFYGYRDRLRALARYAALTLPDDPRFRGLQTDFQAAQAALRHLEPYLGNESRLLSDLLEPAEAAMESYRRRYLQFFDRVTAVTEQTRQQLDQLSHQATYRALSALAQIVPLGGDPRPQLQALLAAAKTRLFPEVTRATVVAQLREWPEPPTCPLTLHNAGDKLTEAETVLAEVTTAVADALHAKAALLHSDALRQRLQQMADDPFIAGLLAAPEATAVADYLAQTLPTDPGLVEKLARALKQIRVRKVALTDFAPSKRTLERGDVEQVTTEFRRFLLAALAADGDEDELAIVELE